jgi:hypothetical protein
MTRSTITTTRYKLCATDGRTIELLSDDMHALHEPNAESRPVSPEIFWPHSSTLTSCRQSQTTITPQEPIGIWPVREAVESSGRSDLRFVADQPSSFKDWNDELRARVRQENKLREKRYECGIGF